MAMTMDSDETAGRTDDEARAALLGRLSKILETTPRPRPPRSLQPTPEAAKGRVARLKRKRRLLMQQSKRTERSA
jgi:hypothetical protein